MADCNIAEAIELVKIYRAQNMPAFLWGAPGIGKTQAIESIARTEKIGLKFLEMSTLEAIDIRGLPMINAQKKIVEWLPPEMLPNEKRDGKEGFWFMDEMNVAHPTVQAACMPLVHEGRCGSYVKPKGWYIVGAGNRQSDRAAAQRMPTALADRFNHIFCELDPKQWDEWAMLNNIDPMIIAFHRWKTGEWLHRMDDSDMICFPTPRSWERASALVNSPDHLRTRAIAGCVGDAAAAEFEAFYKTVTKLPKLKDILKDPKNTPVPDEDQPDALYAITTMLARNADVKNFDKIMTYAQRLGKDFEVVLATDAMKRDPELYDHVASVKFFKRNQDVQI